PARAVLRPLADTQPGVLHREGRRGEQALDRPSIESLAQRDPQWLRVAIDVKPARKGLSTPLHQQFGRPLQLLLTMVGGLLVLACANIGSLLLAPGAARQPQMAVPVWSAPGDIPLILPAHT